MTDHNLLTSEKGRWIDGRRTICEVWREVVDLAMLDLVPNNPGLAERLIALAQEGFGIGIRMQDALIAGKLDGLVSYAPNDPERERLLRLRRDARVKATDDWLMRRTP